MNPIQFESRCSREELYQAGYTPLSQLVRHFLGGRLTRQNLPAYVRPDGMVGRVVQAGAQRAGQPKAEMKIVLPG